VSGRATEGLLLAKCLSCHARFAPPDVPCPRCGSTGTETYRAAPGATVLAATSLEVPPPGWERPHRLALVEVEDGVRLIVIVEGGLPPAGSRVSVWADGPVYRARSAEPEGAERGEGDVPGTGTGPTPL